MNPQRALLLRMWALWASLALLAGGGEGGRPFRTEDNGTVPPGSFGLELGGELAFDKSDRHAVFPTLAFKAGLADRVELGLEAGHLFVKSAGIEEASLADAIFKVKARLYDGSVAIPSLATTFGVILPTAERTIVPGRHLGFLTLAQVSADLRSFIYYVNLGFAFTDDPEERRSRLDEDLLWGLALEIPIHTDVALALDFFGRTQQNNGVAQSGLLGLIWRSPWKIDVDGAVIVGLTPGADDVGLTMGLTYEFPVFGAAGQRQALRRSTVQERRPPRAPVSRTERLLSMSGKQMLQER